MRKARDDYRRSQEMFKEVALELKQRAADLQQTDSIKSLFLATLSHELRNPLTPVIAMAGGSPSRITSPSPVDSGEKASREPEP